MAINNPFRNTDPDLCMSFAEKLRMEYRAELFELSIKGRWVEWDLCRKEFAKLLSDIDCPEKWIAEAEFEFPTSRPLIDSGGGRHVSFIVRCHPEPSTGGSLQFGGLIDRVNTHVLLCFPPKSLKCKQHIIHAGVGSRPDAHYLKFTWMPSRGSAIGDDTSCDRPLGFLQAFMPERDFAEYMKGLYKLSPSSYDLCSPRIKKLLLGLK